MISKCLPIPKGTSMSKFIILLLSLMVTSHAYATTEAIRKAFYARCNNHHIYIINKPNCRGVNIQKIIVEDTINPKCILKKGRESFTITLKNESNIINTLNTKADQWCPSTTRGSTGVENRDNLY